MPASRCSATACRASSTYLLLYSVLTIGSFAVVALVGRSNGGDTSLDGVHRARQAATDCWRWRLTVFLLAQAGVPLTSGFIAKWGVIQAAVEEESYAIAIIAMVAAVDRRVPVPADHGQRVAARRPRVDSEARARSGDDRAWRWRRRRSSRSRRRVAAMAARRRRPRQLPTPVEVTTSTVTRRRTGRGSGSGSPS